MRAAVLLMATAALLTACASGLWSSRRPPEVWLLMGQSNMSGRGDVAELSAALATPDPRVRVWGNDDVLTVAQEPLDSAVAQRDPVSADLQAGVGPGLAFAHARLAHDPDRRPILVPCAKGGSAIAEWTPAEGRHTLFGSCVARAKSASRHGRLTGILWYQGETDAREPAQAAAWAAEFGTFLVGLRQALDQLTLPVVVVSLADPPETGRYAGRYPHWATIQSTQVRLSGPCLAVVSAAGLPKIADDLHLSTAGQQTLGMRLAEAAERASCDENTSFERRAPPPTAVRNDSY